MTFKAAHVSTRVLLNHWRTLQYHDPAEVLRRLRVLEVEFSDVEMDPKLRSLRTSGLKKYRERRDAAVFTYGMGLGKVVAMEYATEESSDYDFVAKWSEGDTQHFCPVQLKELVPEDLNPTTSLSELMAGLTNYSAKTATVLAVKLNRRSSLELPTKVDVAFSQLWFFWASAPDSARWCTYGDVLQNPEFFAFDYPEGPPKNFYGPDGKPLESW